MSILVVLLIVLNLTGLLGPRLFGAGRIPGIGQSGPTATPAPQTITLDRVIACNQSECGEPYFKLTLHTITIDTHLHSMVMEWTITDESTSSCPRLNLWDAALYDPHGNAISATDTGDGGGNFPINPNQPVTRDKLYRALPQLGTPYRFYMEMPTGCNPIFGGDKNGYSLTFTFTDNYRKVDIAHA